VEHIVFVHQNSKFFSLTHTNYGLATLR